MTSPDQDPPEQITSERYPLLSQEINASIPEELGEVAIRAIQGEKTRSINFGHTREAADIVGTAVQLQMIRKSTRMQRVIKPVVSAERVGRLRLRGYMMNVVVAPQSVLNGLTAKPAQLGPVSKKGK